MVLHPIKNILLRWPDCNLEVLGFFFFCLQVKHSWVVPQCFLSNVTLFSRLISPAITVFKLEKFFVLQFIDFDCHLRSTYKLYVMENLISHCKLQLTQTVYASLLLNNSFTAYIFCYSTSTLLLPFHKQQFCFPPFPFHPPSTLPCYVRIWAMYSVNYSKICTASPAFPIPAKYPAALPPDSQYCFHLNRGARALSITTIWCRGGKQVSTMWRHYRGNTPIWHGFPRISLIQYYPF